MQVVGHKENPRSVTIRYRVAKKPPSRHLEGDLYSRYGTTIVKLPQGSAELIAVTSPLEPPFRLDHAWWTTDGKSVDLVPLRPLHGLRSFGKGDQARTFLFRFKDLPADASFPNWNAADCTSSEWIRSVCYADGGVDPNLKMIRVAMGNVKTATVRIGIGEGKWETVTTWKPGSEGKTSFARNGKTFSIEYQKAAATRNEAMARKTLLRMIMAGPLKDEESQDGYH